MKQNIDVFDFALDEEVRAEIMKLDKSSSLFFDYTTFEFVEYFDDISSKIFKVAFYIHLSVYLFKLIIIHSLK